MSSDNKFYRKNIKISSMFVAVFIALFHLFFLPHTPDILLSANTPIHHDLPADHQKEKHTVCPTEIHEFTQIQSAQVDVSCTPPLFSVTHFGHNALYSFMILPIHKIAFSPPPKAQKTVPLQVAMDRS